jgi:UDP-N-acetylmuramate--alanine ligase
MEKIHFVGIGGVGVSALAQHFLHLGAAVSGSDTTKTPLTEKLQAMGIAVHYGHRAENIPAGTTLVVHTSAVKEDNVELIRARELGIATVLREQLLGHAFNGFKNKIAICGVHGKTTTTSLLDYILRHMAVDHAAFVGGLLTDTGLNYTYGSGTVVAEACEYRRSFLNLFPDIIVALNIELDHPDYYKDTADITSAFVSFFKNAGPNGKIVACGDSIDGEILRNFNHATFGFGSGNDFYADNVKNINAHHSFDLCSGGKVLCHVKTQLEGRHNVYNALAALVCVSLLGLDLAEAARHMETFCGTARRYMNVPCDFTNVIEDYAHHPTEIKALIDTVKCHDYRRIFVVFQPHTYSRTAAFMAQFTQCFDGADGVLLLPIYAAREKQMAGVSSEVLCAEINRRGETAAKFFETPFDVYYELTKTATKKDVVLVVGAGDVNEVSELLGKEK